jgi:hypothetical protein
MLMQIISCDRKSEYLKIIAKNYNKNKYLEYRSYFISILYQLYTYLLLFTITIYSILSVLNHVGILFWNCESCVSCATVCV